MVDISHSIRTSQAASRLGCSALWVRCLIKAGTLPAIRTELGYLIDPEDVERLRVQREAKQQQHAEAISG